MTITVREYNDSEITIINLQLYRAMYGRWTDCPDVMSAETAVSIHCVLHVVPSVRLG